ncbi:MAG: LacI family DNA-binding transcriptional regulator [Chloroflexota bacterium]
MKTIFLRDISVMAAGERITITEVAKAAGVSPGTVSRVLNHRNGESKISAATQSRVLEAVERLGYQPNRFASALRTQQTGVIGTIVRDINDPFLGLLARELQHSAHRHHVELLLAHAENEAQTVRRQLSFMRNWFDGLLIVGDMPGDQALFDDLRATRKPFVAVACGTNSPPPLVNIDEEAATRLALDYLYSLGHRRIGFIGNTEHAGTRERLASFQRFIAEKDLIRHEDYIQPTPYSRKDAAASAQRLLGLASPPTAILCTADLMALGAMSGAQQIGWRVPDAVSIISFDDIEEASDVFPALTTVRQPVGAIAEQAVHLLLRLIDQPSDEYREKRVIVQPRLMIRRSCSPAIT